MELVDRIHGLSQAGVETEIIEDSDSNHAAISIVSVAGISKFTAGTAAHFDE